MEHPKPVVKNFPRLEGADVPELLTLLQHPQDIVRHHARIELRKKGALTLPALDKWAAALDRANAEFNQSALEALFVAEGLEQTRPALLAELLKSDSFLHRAAAVRMIRFQADRLPNTADLLHQIAAGPHPRVQMEVVDAIAHLRPAMPAVEHAPHGLTTTNADVQHMLADLKHGTKPAKGRSVPVLEIAREMKSIRPDIAQRIRERKVLCVLVGHKELTSDVPLFSSEKTGKELDFYNWRQRGFLTTKNNRQVVLFAEEDVLEYEGGMQLESILIHEFGHVVQGAGFDKELNARVKATFENAKQQGIYNDGYAAQRFRRVKSETPVSLLDALVKSFPAETREFLSRCLDGGDILVNGRPARAEVKVTREDKVIIVFGGPKQTYSLASQAEYWAEGFQDWYDTNRTMDHDHNHIHTRDQLKAYDPELAKLCAEVLGDSEWRFVSPRTRAGQGHLAGYDPATAPKIANLEHIDLAAQDYYDKYWKDFWKRLHEKHADKAASKAQE